MGKPNHSPKGKGRNWWYRIRNIRKDQKDAADRNTHKKFVAEEEKKKERREASIPSVLPERLRNIGPVSPKATTNWFGKAWSGVKGALRGKS